DGMDLVSNWYMRNPDPQQRSTSGLPRLYQKYTGHDNNRDLYMAAMTESQAVNRIHYQQWFPQIIYNAHQTGPAGTVIFAPPFRDPVNHNLDPLIPLSIEAVGTAMHTRFVAEGKGGSTMRSGASYSTWWNGGLRTTCYYHNMIGLLTEIIGNPTPMNIPFRIERQLPGKNDLPLPIAPQTWRFRQSIEYSITADRAVLDYASRNRETLLYNIYLMGRNSIERGSRDHWTITQRTIDAVQVAMDADRSVDPMTIMHDPEKRDARGYIIPANQPDFLTATKFVNTLIKGGIVIHQAASDFEVAGKTYPPGSYIVKCAQAFRPHILDMFEPQHHPDDIPYPGANPTAPYDSAGYTLAYQMGVEFDRITNGFDGPFEEIEGFAKIPEGRVIARRIQNPTGFLLSHQVNDSFVAVHRLLGAGEQVYWLKDSISTSTRRNAIPAGTMYIPAKQSTESLLNDLTAEFGLTFQAIAEKPAVAMLKINPVKIGLWDRYGGSMPSGWTRWILEQFEFPFELVFPQELDAGNLKDKFDVLVFVTGAIPGGGGRTRSGRQTNLQNIPAEYRDRVGNITADTIEQLKQFMNDGGSVVTIGTSTALGYQVDLPIANALVTTEDGRERPLRSDEYYIPGSVLQVTVDNTVPIAYGINQTLDVYFNRSPVFKLTEASNQVQKVAWFDSDKPLRSGWAWQQQHLKDGLAIVDATVGKGKLYMFGPEIAFRAQSHGTFKFLFNGIYLSAAETVYLK
ncbi:MAG: peptidase, partial [Planctomycetes bacterium]|nr:peptidase [Planctomycetota bacterium]